MNKKQPKKTGALLIVLLVAFSVCIAAVMLRSILPDRQEQRPTLTKPETDQSQPDQAEPQQTIRIEAEEQAPINLGSGLQITDSGIYTGVYMEDGSNDIVSGVMMVVVSNSGEQDIQLANITAVCGDAEYRFSLTNLATGERAVLLDLDRKESGGGGLSSAIVTEIVLFSEPMDRMPDTIEISGMEGMLNVKNISDADIDGDIFIYYKYAAQDIYYGGITFRVRIEGGLKAGELRQIPAGHYSPEGCAIVQVTANG